MDTIAFDLYGKVTQDAETVAKCKEFDEFIDAVFDFFAERKSFYKGLDEVDYLETYGVDDFSIARSLGVTDAVKCERYSEFEGF